MKLVTVAEMMEMERRSGLVIAEEQPAGGGEPLRQLGRLYLRDGQVVRARIEGRGIRIGTDAVYEMLTWTEGQFELWQAEVAGGDEIHARTTFLLMEGMRRMDESTARDENDDAGTDDAAHHSSHEPAIAGL
jgi:hypothetical protein